MISLLSKWLIKNRDSISDPTVRRQYGMLCGMVGVGLNIVLFIIKYLAGVISGSISITADAFNNLSDAGSSVVSLMGFRLAGKAPDPSHPFGHGRIEYISGLIVSFLIIMMAFELGKSSVAKIISPEATEFSTVALVILIISICIKLYMFAYNRAVGKKINSATMSATATDSLSDTVSTAVVLLSMVISRIFSVNIDAWCGVAVSLFILYSGINAVRETLSPLLGQPPEAEFVEKIKSIVMSHPEICGMHDLVVHDYGPGRIMISLHGEVPGNSNIFAIHDVIDQIEDELKSELNCDACIHMDPIDTDDENVAIMRNNVVEIVKGVDGLLSIHDFRMVHGCTHTNLIFDLVTPHGYSIGDDELRVRVSSEVEEKFENHKCVIKVERSYV